MPLPDAMLGLIHRRRFWTDYIFETEADLGDYPELGGDDDDDDSVDDGGGDDDDAKNDDAKDDDAGDGDDDDDDPSRIEFHIVDDYRLVLDVSSFLGVITLTFTSMLEHEEIGHDDRAHWHPHVLRWEELELICKLIAANDETLPHPGLPLLLLYRFAPICIGDDVDRIVSMLTRAWRSLGIFRDTEILRFIEKMDRRTGPYGEFRWVSEEVEVEDEEWVSDAGSVDADESAASQPQPETGVAGKNEPTAQAPTLEVAGSGEVKEDDDDERESTRSKTPKDAEPQKGKWKVTKRMQTHWYIEQPESKDGLYTKRWKGGTTFPHQAWEDMISAAKRALAELGDASTVPGGDDADGSPKLQLRTKHIVELEIPIGKGLESYVCSMTISSLNRILHNLNLGTASIDGSSSCVGPDGRYVTQKDYVSLGIFGDLDRGLQIVRHTLWWARAQASAGGSAKQHNDAVPFSLDPGLEPSANGPGSLHFQAVRLSTGSPEDYWPVSFDELVPRDGLRTATLNDLGLQIEGPDQHFWYEVTAADGGESRFCFGIIDEKNDENLSSCTVEVTKLTPRVVEALYRFLREYKLALFPVRIVVDPPDSRVGKMAHHVAGHEELFQILSAGPFAWWQTAG